MDKRIYRIFCVLFGIILFQQNTLLSQATSSLSGNVQASSPMQHNKQVFLTKILTDYEKQFEVYFTFESSLIRNKVVRNDFKVSGSLEQNLNNILTPLGLKFVKVSDKYYTISQSLEQKKLETNLINYPVENRLLINLDEKIVIKIAVSGNITDENGVGMPGVSVLEKTTLNGTITNVKGNFTLNVANENSILVVSFTGYSSQEIVVGKRSEIILKLIPDIKSLSEVVVVGYGTVKKSDLTGAVSSISNKEIKAIPATSIDQLLQGRASGVQVSQASHAPGGGVNVRIRGGSSISAGNEPLYVIDGIPVYNDNTESIIRSGSNLSQPTNALSSLNLSDIENIEILKDASATGIYGARGANGVVIITTRRGKTGQSVINFESYYGVQNIQRRIPLLNTSDFVKLLNDSRLNDNDPRTGVIISSDSIGTNTDWQNEVLQQAPIQNFQLSASGGEEKTRYVISANYFKQDGIVRASSFDRMSLRLNLDRKLTKRLSIGNNLTISRSTSDQVSSDAARSTLVAAQQLPPFIPVKDANGFYNNSDYYPAVGVQGDIDSPILPLNEGINRIITSRLLGNLFAEYTISDNLKFRTSIGADASFVKSNSFGAINIKRDATGNSAQVGNVQITQWINENQLTYSKRFKQHHNLTLTGVYSLQQYKRESALAVNSRFPNSSVTYNSLSTGTQTTNVTFSSENAWSFVSYTARANYDYDSKYFLTATIRQDGSSRFGNDNKYGIFPSASAAWVVSKETFMQKMPFISFLKLRGSYGLIGNSEIPSYSSLDLLSTDFTLFNNVQNVGYVRSRLSNPDLRWEKTQQLDLGVDVGLVKDRISLTVDYFRKNTSDLLYNVSVPRTTGFNSALVNIGSLENKGFEIALNTVNLEGAFRWTTSLNFSAIKNKIIDLGGTDNVISGNVVGTATGLLRVGQPIGLFYGYQRDGIFQTNDEISVSAQSTTAQPGDVRYKDLNGDKIIDANDRTVLGNAQPDFFGGMTNNFSYKGFELNVFINGVSGNKIANLNRLNLENLTGTINQSAEVLNRWTGPNTSNVIPRATRTPTTPNFFSDRYVEDGSFLRLRNITFAYNLPATLLNKANIRAIRVYVSGQNLVTFTKYSGYDPEVNSGGSSSTTLGVDFGSYPSSGMFLVGLNASF